MADQVLGYDRTGALVIGLLQIVIAVVMICIQIPMYTEEYYGAHTSTGIWAGGFFIICGVISIYSWKKNTRILIVVAMVLDIIGSLAAAVGIFITCVVGLLVSHLTAGYHYYQYELGEIHKRDTADRLYYTMLAMCVVEGVICIVGSALCCKAVCCVDAVPLEVVYVASSQDDKPLPRNEESNESTNQN